MVTLKFADFITNYLEKNNLSYRKMAELCDISHSEIGRLANGEEPSIKTINKISSAIDVSRTKLLRLAGYLDDNSEASPNLIEDFTDGELNSLNSQDIELLIELSQDEQLKQLLWESQKLSSQDLSKIIQIIRSITEKKEINP